MSLFLRCNQIGGSVTVEKLAPLSVLPRPMSCYPCGRRAARTSRPPDTLSPARCTMRRFGKRILSRLCERLPVNTSWQRDKRAHSTAVPFVCDDENTARQHATAWVGQHAAQKASFSPHAQQRPSRGDIGVDVVLMASPSGERITKRDVVATESARVSRGSGMPLKAFGNWRAKFKAEPQPPARKLRRRPR